MVWNLEDRFVRSLFHSDSTTNAHLYRDGAEWVAQLRDTYEKFEGGSPQFRLNLWRATFSTPSYTKYFEPPKEDLFKWTLIATRDTVTNRVLSKSYIAIQPEEQKEKIVKDLEAIVERGDSLVWVDKEAGTFEWPYYTLVVTWRKN